MRGEFPDIVNAGDFAKKLMERADPAKLRKVLKRRRRG